MVSQNDKLKEITASMGSLFDCILLFSKQTLIKRVKPTRTVWHHLNKRTGAYFIFITVFQGSSS